MELGHLVNQRIGRLLQATRKHLGLSQSVIAPQLGLDQGGLSRVESGKQLLTAAQWFKFCTFTGVSLNAVMDGLIEIRERDSAMRLPKKFNFEKHSRVRSLIPILQFSRDSLGERSLNSFLEAQKLSTDYFANLEARINFNFTIDLVEMLMRKTGITSKDAHALTRTASEGRSHGSLRSYYDHISSNQLNLIKGFVQNASRYDENFRYEIVHASDEQIEIEFTPLPHMEAFSHCQNPELSNFLIHYAAGFLQNFSSYGGRRPLEAFWIEQPNKECHRIQYRTAASEK